MPKLPIVKGKDFYDYLVKYGCDPISSKGSHFKVKNPGTRISATVPIHSGKDLGKGLFAGILTQLAIAIRVSRSLIVYLFTKNYLCAPKTLKF
ncbi:MAG: type II toxin-antitoxin system HicA family toxin [Oscillospiraceae bacterium]|nr:type II toxin-antitoxin system HicA family toxin [Oscillospiraceae bacterium]